MSRSQIATLVVVGLAGASFFYFDIGSYLEFSYLQDRQDALLEYVASNPLRAALGYFAIYVAVAALSLPGAAVLTLIGGAAFGLVNGTLLVSFASTIGATCAFLLSRYLFRDVVAEHFQTKLDAIDEGIKKDGAFYLFTLRLVPIFPFFVINLVMGLTGLRARTFAWISQAGMLPATVVFVNAGRQLADIQTPTDILSLELLASFALLGIFPLIVRKIMQRLNRWRALKAFPKPARFDRNLVVIGAGSAGLVSSYIAAASKAKVTLIEKHKMGGDCLNTGCVPSKALLRTAKLLHQSRHSQKYGIASLDAKFEFADVLARVKRVVDTIAPHDSIERYTKLGVECISGEAKVLSPFRVKVGERELTTRNIILATGASPFVPPIPGLESFRYLTSDNLWELRELPQRLLVLGGGPIGCELSQAFARLGSTVTQIEMAPRLLMREDPLISDVMLDALRKDGVVVQLNRQAVEFRQSAAANSVICNATNSEDDPLEIGFDEVLVAVGRRANAKGYGLEELGVELNKNGTIATDEFLATKIPNIYACGDVSGPYQFTHTASHQAWFATMNSLFGGFKRFAVDYSVIPWCTFTDPEIARVGLNESDALAKQIPFELSIYDVADLDRAIADEAATGTVRVLTVPGKDKILGVTIVAEHAGDLIAEFVLAMKHGLGLKKILNTIHIYPTLAEANKMAAGNWRRQHIPAWLPRLLTGYHRYWLRS